MTRKHVKRVVTRHSRLQCRWSRASHERLLSAASDGHMRLCLPRVLRETQNEGWAPSVPHGTRVVETCRLWHFLLIVHTTYHCQDPLTGYKHRASECLTVSNTVACNHTDSVSHSIHQRQSCDIPNKLQVCRSVKHHHCPIDEDLTYVETA